MEDDNDESQWITRREKLVRLLKENEGIYDIKQILKDMEYSSKHTFLEDLDRVAHTLKNEGIIVEMAPASCIGCGYIFPKKHYEFKIPSKCPKCKQQRINWPGIKIIKK